MIWRRWPVFRPPMLEIGRFCLAPSERDADPLRLIWAALTRIVDAEGVGLMFGCSSFPGIDPAPHADALALLAQGHVGPHAQRPGRKAAETVPLVALPHDRRQAMAQMPPLLRSYIGDGGMGRRSRRSGPRSGHAACVHRR